MQAFRRVLRTSALRNLGTTPASVPGMPIYEYECDVCAHRFEQLVMPAQAQHAVDRTCPSCRSTAVRQVPSLFAVDSESTRQMNKSQGRRVAQKNLTDQ